MKLSLNHQNDFLLEGSGKEFRMIASHLLSTSQEKSAYIDYPDIVKFYQSLLHASNKDLADSIQLITTSSVLEWMFKAMRVISKIRGETEELLTDLHYQFRLLQKDDKTEGTFSLKDRLLLEYQNILGIKNIKKMTAFIESFDVTENEFQQMVVTSFLESYPAVKLKDVRLDMLERIYHHFFNHYESLLAETHLLYSFPSFKEQITIFYQEYKELHIQLNNPQYIIGLYLLYFDMVLKGLEDGFVYQAEDEHILFDWIKPLFNRIAVEHIKQFQSEEKIDRNNDKEMNLFREIYIKEISKSFQHIERIENDQENPYNVVFVLKGNRKVVCNTWKHYQWYVQEEVKGHGKERVRSMEEFIQKISPTNKSTSHTDLFNQPFEDVRKNIYPMIRLISSSPIDAIYRPFTDELGVYYGVRIEENGKTQYAIIMKRLLEKWEIDNEVLNQTALENLQRKKPSFVTYQEVMKKQLNQEQLRQIPSAYKDLYMYAGKSAIDSSYLLDLNTLQRLKKVLKTDTLILSMPVRDCLLVTKKEHFPLLKKLTTQLYESHSAKLSPDIIEESEGEWNSMK